jgi:hypothetical protein
MRLSAISREFAAPLADGPGAGCGGRRSLLPPAGSRLHVMAFGPRQARDASPRSNSSLNLSEEREVSPVSSNSFGGIEQRSIPSSIRDCERPQLDLVPGMTPSLKGEHELATGLPDNAVRTTSGARRSWRSSGSRYSRRNNRRGAGLGWGFGV